MSLTIRLKNIKFEEYLHGISENERDRYDFAIKFGNVVEAIDHLKIGSFSDCKFGFVKEFQQLYANVDITPNDFYNKFFIILKQWLGVERQKILRHTVFEFYDIISYIAKEIKTINKLEENLISNIGSIDDEDTETFSKFGFYPQLLTLAGGDITKIDTVENYKYDLCFTYLLYEKEQYEFKYRQNKKHIRNG